MIFGQNRDELRQMYITAWKKAAGKEVMSPLETQIAAVIEIHPEYQSMLTAEFVEESFSPEQGRTNPFLHMGLHLAIREQVATDRPAGIRQLFKQLCERYGDLHEAEHVALECLAETLWDAQNRNVMPDDNAYLESFRRL